MTSAEKKKQLVGTASRGKKRRQIPTPGFLICRTLPARTADSYLYARTYRNTADEMGVTSRAAVLNDLDWNWGGIWQGRTANQCQHAV